MLFSIALLLLVGMAVGEVFRRLRLPYIIGMLCTGILLGPYCLGLLDESLLAISGDLRKIALIIILAKAGLSLDIADLRRIGRPAVLLCFLPATFELGAFLLFAPAVLGVTRLEAAILGAVMGAVSPAVIVPRMTKMMDEGWGTKKGIPQMIVAGASADDVYVIVIFTALLSLASGGSVSAGDFLQIPVAIVLGILAGAAVGAGMVWFFNHAQLRATVKTIILMAVSMLLVCLEDALAGIVSLSGLLAIMSMCIFINNRKSGTAKHQAVKLGKLWLAAEIFLFVLVGATVNIAYITRAGLAMVAMLFIGLAFRLAGTYLSVMGTGLNRRETLFCLFSQLPKATVQAAIGGVPLSMGLACGNTVLAFAVLAIVVTAPLGALLIDATYQRWLTHDKPE